MERFDPSRPDFAPYGLTVERWAPTLMPRPDRHNEIELNLLEHGSLTYLLGGTKVTVEAGRLTIFWAAIPHQVVAVQDQSNYHVATVPLAWFLQWGLPPRLVDPILHGGMICEPGAKEAARDAAAFARWQHDLARPTQARRRIVLLEVQARLLRLGLALPAAPPSPAASSPRSRSAALESPALSKAEEIACFLATHYREPLTIGQVGKAVGLHPNYAMNLFKKVFATTLTQYLTQHRLSHAQRLLATTNSKILSVAMESGFGSVSRFNDAFRKAFGCSPRAYRQEHRA
ncbi:MAG TPA: helix-turn-helix domain-containing protein [Tepidisphaeraceae bacterium]|nr:helix-turn-helix domain-containing protein [Tepidisphaeraceae bacterium]